MAEDKEINVSLVPKSLDKAMENIMYEPSKSIGKTLGDIWFLIFGGFLGQLAEKRKLKYTVEFLKYKKEIEREINNIPTEDKVELDFQILGSVFEASKFCLDKAELRKMFSKLIASSMNRKVVECVHPSFGVMISQMCTDEAKLVKFLKEKIEINENRFPIVDIVYFGDRIIKEDGGRETIMRVDLINETISSVKTNLTPEEIDIERHCFSGFSDIGISCKCDKYSNLPNYLQNLNRMGIIEFVNREIVFCDDYSRIIESQFMRTTLFSLNVYSQSPKRTYGFIKKYFKVTDFGRNFLEACVS